MSETISGNSQWNGLDMPRRLWAIMAVAFGVAASVISGAIVNVALPTFSAEMSVSSVTAAYIYPVWCSLRSLRWAVRWPDRSQR